MEFALKLETAMENCTSYGYASPEAVRAAVGRLRRQLPSSLVTALKAVRFLQTRHPEVLATRDARIGCAQVRLLARIDELSPEAAAEVKPRVFSRAIRQADLRAYHQRLSRTVPDRARPARVS